MTTLADPHVVLLRFLGALSSAGSCREEVFLSSARPEHRWAAASYPDLRAEFEQKADWVALQLRRKLGASSAQAHRVLVECGLAGLSAAAWTLGEDVGYVSLRDTCLAGDGISGSSARLAPV